MIPIIIANTNIPPIVVQNATARCQSPSASACVPGSATYVHDFHIAPDKSVSPGIHINTEEVTMTRNVIPSRSTGFASLVDEK
eukprot:1191878-Rhodomonas_salina.1